MINLSIDAADLEGRFDPTVNEIESIVELVLEVILDNGDVLPEQDEPDPESETCFLGLDHIIPLSPFQFEACLAFVLAEKAPTKLPSHLDPFISIQSPPPKFIS